MTIEQTIDYLEKLVFPSLAIAFIMALCFAIPSPKPTQNKNYTSAIDYAEERQIDYLINQE